VKRLLVLRERGQAAVALIDMAACFKEKKSRRLWWHIVLKVVAFLRHFKCSILCVYSLCTKNFIPVC